MQACKFICMLESECAKNLVAKKSSRERERRKRVVQAMRSESAAKKSQAKKRNERHQ